MARPIAQIQQQMLDSIASDSVLGGLLTSTSKRAIYRLFTYIIASAINLHEQLIDIFTSNVETIAASASPATPSWLQNQILNFQYSDTNPQTIQFLNFAPQYPVVDPTLRIISRCSVNTSAANQVQIKVATGNPPSALTSAQLSALQGFINPPYGIGIAGVTYIVTSSNADKLYINANIYYNGQYSTVIATNVQAAINNYLSLLPFNGQLKISDLEIAIKSVQGVTDVLLINVAARADSTPFGSGVYLVQNQQIISRLWNTVSGYIVPETTSGQTPDLSLNYYVS